MSKIFKFEGFFSLITLVWVLAAAYASSSISFLVVIWGFYAIFNVYMYTIERVIPSIPAAIAALVAITGGYTSPLMPLLFLTLPILLKLKPKEYPYFALLAFIEILATGRNVPGVLTAIAFLFSAASVFAFSVESLRQKFGKFFKKEIKEETETIETHEDETQLVKDPLMPLRNYIDRVKLWENEIPISINLLKIVDSSKGVLFIKEKQIELKGLISMAADKGEDVVCGKAAAEAEEIVFMPNFDTRFYFPITLFDYGVFSEPEYIVVIDADTSKVEKASRNELMERLRPIKGEIINLLRSAETFRQIQEYKTRFERLYTGSRDILSELSKKDREFVYLSAGKYFFATDSAISAVLITEKRNEKFVARLYERNNDSELGVHVAKNVVLDNHLSHPLMMFDRKLGRQVEIKNINKRDNPLFEHPELDELNKHSSLFSFLIVSENRDDKKDISTEDAPLLVVSLFMDASKTFSRDIQKNISLFNQILYSALKNIEMYEKIEELSNIDGLTGLYNRRYLQEQLGRMVLEANRSSKSLSVIMVDIDFFKKINDTYGHKAGDDVLRFMGKVLKSNLRQVDMAARYGGEEFMLVLHNTDKQGAELVAGKVMEHIRRSVIIADGKQLSITSSFGVADLSQASYDSGNLVKMADQALYTSKENGRDRITVAG